MFNSRKPLLTLSRNSSQTSATYPKLQLIQSHHHKTHHHITLILESLNWLIIQERIHFHVLSLTYNYLQYPHTPQTSLQTPPFTQLAPPNHIPVLVSPPHYSSKLLQPSHIHHCNVSST